MKKQIAAVLLLSQMLAMPAYAADSAVHIVRSGESLWKIAVRYEVGIQELKSANPQIENFDLIYPGQSIQLPGKDNAALQYESEVIRLVNEIRAENGLSALSYDWELARVARYKSQDMRDNGYFSHTSPVYGSPFTMIKNFGLSYRSAGENIARGQRTPEEVVNAWMHSEGHRANILNASYKKIGVGYVPDGRYWTQMFIG